MVAEEIKVNNQQTLNNRIMLANPGGLNILTRVLFKNQGDIACERPAFVGFKVGREL